MQARARRVEAAPGSFEPAASIAAMRAKTFSQVSSAASATTRTAGYQSDLPSGPGTQ